jgi:SRSO17 transposase
MSARVPAQVAQAEREIESVTARLRLHFRRGAAHRHAGEYVRGLLGPVERKNGWQLAEHVGHRHPRSIRRVLDRSAWDADAVRDDLLDQVVAELGDDDGVLVIDETGFLKKGTKSCGVARQYSGTAGRIENCQVGVFLGYASAKGRAGIDRALYLPREWADDAERRAEAGVPEAVAFRTKPALALEMLERAFEADVPARWVVGDAVYGSDGKLRRALEAWGQAYALAVKSTEKPTTFPPYAPPGQVMAADVADGLEPDAWQRLSCGAGAQGERLYDWAYVPLRPGLRRGWVHALVIRRDLHDPTERATTWCSPRPTPRSPRSSGPSAPAGRSRTSSSSPSARSASTSTRSAPGPAGIVMSPSRCSPSPPWSSGRQKGGRATRARPRPRLHPRAASPHDAPATRLSAPGSLRARLVVSASPASSHRPRLPRQTPTPGSGSETVTVGLECLSKPWSGA